LSQEDEFSFSAILNKLDKPPSEKTLKRDLTVLKNLGIIDVRGHTWTAVWFLKSK